MRLWETCNKRGLIETGRDNSQSTSLFVWSLRAFPFLDIDPMELADVFDQMVFPCEAITSFTSAIVHGTISILRLVYARFVPLQVGRASETTSTYTYELLWLWTSTGGRVFREAIFHGLGIVDIRLMIMNFKILELRRKLWLVIEALIGIAWHQWQTLVWIWL